MSQSLEHFLAVCTAAFDFIVADYGFHVRPTLEDRANPYVMEFSNSEIVLRIVGEGYGTVARVEYVTVAGHIVPSAVLDPDWQPKLGRKRSRRTRRVASSQDDQIVAAAAQIRARDHAILRGDYAQLEIVADRYRQLLARLGIARHDRQSK